MSKHSPGASTAACRTPIGLAAVLEFLYKRSVVRILMPVCLLLIYGS